MLRRQTFSGLAILLLAALYTPIAAAGSDGTPGAFVTNLAQKALDSANDKTLSTSDRQRGLGALLDTGFDMPQIGSYVVGPYWQGASADERQAFIVILSDYVARTYSQRFADYDKASFRVVGQRDETVASSVVFTNIDKTAEAAWADQTAPNRPVRLDWLVALGSSEYRIVDVTVDGISMAETMRAEFISYLRHHGGDLPSLTQRLQLTAIAMQ